MACDMPKPCKFPSHEMSPCFTTRVEDGEPELVEPELACKADGVASPDPV